MYVEKKIEKVRIDEMNTYCPLCFAKHFRNERMNCCHKGKVDKNICPDIKVPEFFKQIMTSNDSTYKHYMNRIRYYNSALAFASIAVNRQIFENRGPFIFKIQGQLYHFVGPLHPDDNAAPAFAALFMMNMSEAHEYRAENANLRPELLYILENEMKDCNPYCKLLFHMSEIEEQYGIEDYRLLFSTENTFDQRRYNLASTNEIAAAFVTDMDGCPAGQYDFFVYSRNIGIRKLPYLNPHVDPMCYPLLFPCGDPGWKPGMNHNSIFSTEKRHVTTQLQFYTYRLAVRDGFSIIHSGGQLFQQYIVDSYVKVEGSRIAFIRTHQQELRSEHYNVLLDFANTNTPVPPGIPVILPVTFLGSPRYMQQNYQDAMSIVARYGKPDLFITFTANTNWPEIINNMDSWNTVENRPDLVARVFQLKLKQLLFDIIKQKIFGLVVAHIYVIEFQKRGLPHAHILIILHPDYKIRGSDEIDSIVCAEIPNRLKNPDLFHVVTKYMVHSPCGNLNLNAPCMLNGVCSRNYPKEFRDETTEKDGFPVYRRRECDPIAIGNQSVDNRWIVPYNPYLSTRYQAHINVEVCASVKSVKYLFKYVYKGHDCASFGVKNTNEENDEVQAYLNTRYTTF